MSFEKRGNERHQYRNREVWCRGYDVNAAGKDTAYIQNRLKKNELASPLTMEAYNPFNG